MNSKPSNDAAPAGKLKHAPTAPASKAAKRAQCAQTPVTDTEASGSGDQGRVPGSQQEAAAARQSAQDEQQLSANGSAGAKVEDPVVHEALGVASHRTAAAGTIKREKEAAPPVPLNGSIGKLSTAGKPITAGTRSKAAGQLSTALNAGQSHGTAPAIQESVSVTELAAGIVPKPPDTAAANDLVDPAVPVQQISANSGLPHQTDALAHPVEGPPSSSSFTAASGAVPISPGPTAAALAASTNHDAPAPTGVSLASASDASVLPMSESAKTTAAVQEPTAPSAQFGVHGVAAPVEGAVRKRSESAQGFQAQQQSPAEVAAVAAAPAEAMGAVALANGDAVAPLDHAPAVQVNRPELQAGMHDMLRS